MTEPNGNRTTSEWLQIIYQENEEAHRRIEDKLDTKVDKVECERRQELKEKVKDRKVALTAAGIAGAISLVVALGGWFVGG